MITEEQRRRLSAIATNATIAAMETIAGRTLMTDHDAETRDTVFAFLSAVQATEQAPIGNAIPMVAEIQGQPDPRLARVHQMLSDELLAAE